MDRLKGKIAVITGASDSFARAIAAGYAREGAAVYLQDFADKAQGLEKTAAAVSEAGGKAATGIHDIATAAGTAAMTKAALAAQGRIDILVNTAAGGWHGKFFEATEADWDKALDRGLKSYFLCCQHVGKEMARRGSGKIINITSIVGRLGSGGAVPWGAARGGVDALTSAVAQALGHYGINVVALARGATDSTPYSPAARAERLRRLPFGRLGDEGDVVGPAIFLATDEARWIHGSVVYCDGGYVTAAATDDEHRPTEVPYRGA
jgi:NAD(P)-dependent dehydrogenase (short-subunit alcohol dehydrogenase family)